MIPHGRAKAILAAFFLSLLTCRGSPEVASGRDRLVALMGEIDAHLLGVQQAGGDPIENDRLRGHLASIRERLERARALDLPHEGLRSNVADALETLGALERAEWTATTRTDRYAALRRLCVGCHKEIAPPVADGRRAPTSWESCGRCHEKAYREWEGTLHARAWTDPVYRMSAGTPPKHECRSCHSMEPILERAISTAVSYRPLFRPYNHEEGVNCASCHGLADGSVAAARDLPDAPCRPRREPRLRSPEFCGACHNPTHGAYDEWKASGSRKSCTDCHARHEGGFTHRMLGVHDAAFVKGALDWSCAIRGGEVVIEITNRSAHKFPAEVPSRTLRVSIDVDGVAEEHYFRRPPKASIGVKDNRLEPGETRVVRRALAGGRRVGVAIRFQRSPFERPEDWILLGSWENPR